MAHPFAAQRQSKVEHSRVAPLTRGYASGGAVPTAAPVVARNVAPKQKFAMGGAVTAPRLDRPARAKGGRVPRGTNVNVIIAPQGAGAPTPSPMAGVGPAPMPVRPPPAMAGPPPGPMPVPGGAPPGMPIRSHGGRTYASGGAVKTGPAYEEGKRLGTKVQHAPGKNDQKDVGRKRVVTYKTGGAVSAPATGRHGPKFDGGGGGGIARMQKAKRAAKKEM